MRRDIVTIAHKTPKELGWPGVASTTFIISINGIVDFVGSWRSARWNIAYLKRRGAKIKGIRRLRH